MQPVTRLRDGSCTLKATTMEELSTEQFALVDSYRSVNGYIMFAPNVQELPTIPKEPAVGRYSPSQQLRMALLRVHLSKGGNKDNFQPFYEKEMARIITIVENALE